MTMDNTLLQHAQAVIDRHGPDAANVSLSMIVHYLWTQNREQASRWLQIGHAIDTLTSLDAAGPKH
jgi:hypothetical protein